MVTWLPNKDLVAAFTILCPGPLVHTPWVLPLNPPNPPNVNPNPRANTNNLNCDPRIVGKAPFAKKTRGCKFVDLIREINTKGHPVPTNTFWELHCLFWHLRGKYITDCHHKADHTYAPPEVINPLIV